LDILLNGVSTGNTIPVGFSPNYSFGAWTPFTIASGFIAGVNTLHFVVNNDAGPTGIRVELTGTADPSPEPASLFLLGAGLVAFGIFRRRLA